MGNEHKNEHAIDPPQDGPKPRVLNDFERAFLNNMVGLRVLGGPSTKENGPGVEDNEYEYYLAIEMSGYFEAHFDKTKGFADFNDDYMVIFDQKFHTQDDVETVRQIVNDYTSERNEEFQERLGQLFKDIGDTSHYSANMKLEGYQDILLHNDLEGTYEIMEVENNETELNLVSVGHKHLGRFFTVKITTPYKTTGSDHEQKDMIERFFLDPALEYIENYNDEIGVSPRNEVHCPLDLWKNHEFMYDHFLRWESFYGGSRFSVKATVHTDLDYDDLLLYQDQRKKKDPQFQVNKEAVVSHYIASVLYREGLEGYTRWDLDRYAPEDGSCAEIDYVLHLQETGSYGQSSYGNPDDPTFNANLTSNADMQAHIEQILDDHFMRVLGKPFREKTCEVVGLYSPADNVSPPPPSSIVPLPLEKKPEPEEDGNNDDPDSSEDKRQEFLQNAKDFLDGDGKFNRRERDYLNKKANELGLPMEINKRRLRLNGEEFTPNQIRENAAPSGP